MPKKITISMDEDAAARLLELAGSPRRQGEFVSKLIHSVYENRQTSGSSMANETLKLQITGVVAELNQVRSRLMVLEQARMQ